VQFFEISGGNRLKGSVSISGAKNAALPIMAASILVDGESILHNVPDLADVRQMQTLLMRLGVKSHRDAAGAMHLRVEDEMNAHAEYELVSKMRASVCVMGPLLAKRRRAQVSMPGGCAIGDRPIDLHIAGLKTLGSDFELVNGDVLLRAKRLKGAEVFLVIGTSAVASGKTISHEPGGREKNGSPGPGGVPCLIRRRTVEPLTVMTIRTLTAPLAITQG
jgi:UDP-N-acetylglucosamine 1-carboxyvinyltransferase